MIGASGRLVIDGPPAAVARLTLRRTAAQSQDEVELPGAPMRLGTGENVTLQLPLSRGFPLGSGGAVLPVHVRARDAFITVEDATARP